VVEVDDEEADSVFPYLREGNQSFNDVDQTTSAAIHQMRLFSVFSIFGDDLGYWVKPRSTTWFSRFLLEQYNDDHWLTNFRMSKRAVFMLAEILKPHVQKQDTRYRLAIPVIIMVACTLFKLAQGASLLICSKIFAIGTSTVSKILREIVYAINDVMRHEIAWLAGLELLETENAFKDLCGLPGVVGAIDGTHIAMNKPKQGPADYYYFKSGGYSLNCQAVVDSEKRFIDLFLGMPGSTNDSWVLRRSSLYHRAQQNMLFDRVHVMEGFSSYLLGDSGYPVLPWLMTPHKNVRNLTVTKTLFNHRLKRGRCVVENAFGILKQTFRELLGKSELTVTFLPDVIVCCAILHNILLAQSREDVEHLLHVLRQEGLHGEVVDEDNFAAEVPDMEGDGVQALPRQDKCTALGVYLATARNVCY
jgi:hypothetical protein